MKMQISYIDNELERIELPYSDEILITEIEKRITKVNANEIEMHFCQDNDRYGSIFVSIYKRNNGRVSMNGCAALNLHRIDLEEDTFKSNLKEYQREKRLIQKYFPNIKVSSNFR